jgi:STE24 endopeptidase
VNEDKASRYHRLIRRARVLSLVIGLGALAALIKGGGSALLRDAIVSWTAADPSAPSTVALFALVLVIAGLALRLPVALYQGFLLERRYGLSSETLASWLRDYAKAAVLVIVLAVGAAEIIYAAMRWSSQWWWIPAAACFSGAMLVLARVAPVALFPLFYHFEPLERETLRARLAALSARAGVPVLGAYVWGLGDKTKRANAALIGTGSTRRILLSDTLLANYSDDEIEVILAHEMGHHVRGDIRNGLLLEAALIFASLGTGAAILSAWWQPLGLAAPSDVAGLPLLFLVGAVVTFASAPALNALSRRNERRADRYALKLTGHTEAFVSAMRRLGAQNLAEERPSRAAVWLFHTHPPIEERIENARRYRTSR